MSARQNGNLLFRKIRILFAVGAFSISSWALTVYVAPDGSDHNPGTRDRPVQTLQHARDLLRRAPKTEPRRMLLFGGIYQDVELVLGPEDSGLVIEPVPGQKPILYGGVPLTHWKPCPDLPGVWQAPVPSRFSAGKGSTSSGYTQNRIRLLVVDGQIRPRARYPTQGTLKHRNAFRVPWMSTTGGGWKRRPTQEELTHLRFRPEDLGPWLDPLNAEITIYHMWDSSTVGIRSIDWTHHVLILDPSPTHPPGAFGVQDYVIWNVRKGLTRPGQWMHDRRHGRILYRPLPGERMDRIDAWIPTQFHVIWIRGTRSQPVRKIRIHGIEIRCTNVPFQSGGFAAARFPGAIEMEYAEHCQIDHVQIRAVAGHAINGRTGIRQAMIQDNQILYTGAGGIYVGGNQTRIVRNRVEHIGTYFPSAIGIYRGGQQNLVAFNLVAYTSYSAINYGGVQNLVVSNLLHHCMQFLHDGAAIYMFAARGCVLRGNVAYDVFDTGGYGSSAYYLDERSTGSIVEGNLSLGVARPLHMHMATNNIVRKNLMLVNGDARLTFPKSARFTLEGNILYADGKIRIENVGAISRWGTNIFYSKTGKYELVWQRNYHRLRVDHTPPPRTLTADPQIQRPTRGLFRFPPGSPARQIGIESFDFRKVFSLESQLPKPGS